METPNDPLDCEQFQFYGCKPTPVSSPPLVQNRTWCIKKHSPMHLLYESLFWGAGLHGAGAGETVWTMATNHCDTKFAMHWIVRMIGFDFRRIRFDLRRATGKRLGSPSLPLLEAGPCEKSSCEFEIISVRRTLSFFKFLCQSRCWSLKSNCDNSITSMNAYLTFMSTCPLAIFVCNSINNPSIFLP